MVFESTLRVGKDGGVIYSCSCWLMLMLEDNDNDDGFEDDNEAVGGHKTGLDVTIAVEINMRLHDIPWKMDLKYNYFYSFYYFIDTPNANIGSNKNHYRVFYDH